MPPPGHVGLGISEFLQLHTPIKSTPFRPPHPTSTKNKRPCHSSGKRRLPPASTPEVGFGRRRKLNLQTELQTAPRGCFVGNPATRIHVDKRNAEKKRRQRCRTIVRKMSSPCLKLWNNCWLGGENRPNFCLHSPLWATFEPIPAKLGNLSARFDIVSRYGPIWDPSGPKLPQKLPSLAELDQIWLRAAEACPESAKIWPKSTKVARRMLQSRILVTTGVREVVMWREAYATGQTRRKWPNACVHCAEDGRWCARSTLS